MILRNNYNKSWKRNNCYCKKLKKSNKLSIKEKNNQMKWYKKNNNN